MRWRFWRLFGGIALVVGLGFLGFGAFSSYLEHRYRTDGHVVQGTVLTKSIWHTPSSLRGSRSSTASYDVTYRFTLPDGHMIESVESVPRRTWSALKERGPVRVVYLPTAPVFHRVDREPDPWFDLAFLCVGGVLSAIGGFVVWKSLRQIHTTRRLRLGGMRTDATLTRVVETNMSVGHRTLWELHYRYLDHMGAAHEGCSEPLPADEAATWRAGDNGMVCFNAQRSNQSIWLGRTDSPPQ